MGGKLEKGRLALLKCEEVSGFVVGSVVCPAAVEDANPLEGEGAQSGLVAHAAGATAVVEGFRPERARDGLSNPLDEALADEGGAAPAPVDPSLVAAAFGDWGDAGVLLKCGGVWEAFPALAEGDEESRARVAPAPGRAQKRW